MLKVLDHIEEWLITFLMGAATLIIFVSVVHRYGSGLSIPGVQDWLLSLHFGWAQELTIIMFVWMAKFGAAYGVRTGIHVGVDVLINRLSDANRAKFVVIGLGAGALFTGIVGTLGLTFVLENGAHYQFLTWFGMDVGDLYEGPTTPDLEWPTWIVYSAIPLGSYLMCFRFLQVMVSFIRTGELPHHDHGHVDGIDEEHLPVDANYLDMGDNLHPHDLKHKQFGENRNKGRDDGQGGKP
ncbi:TRAP transporter small permease [Aromatoleum toluolicum]|uniref:TRAP transporter small permease protein n=1 Tax=Aromatoleum toluolicum TaxID=90060 RepID=A0ABX1NF38_9RHOO|nr:TRAP transporter small permease [Aromatoleum toluolicum]NMF97891.1 TRAP transporter small permease [Aromatoleum toluolicum]